MAAPICLARAEALWRGKGGEGAAGGNKRRRVLSDTGSCLSGGGGEAGRQIGVACGRRTCRRAPPRRFACMRPHRNGTQCGSEGS